MNTLGRFFLYGWLFAVVTGPSDVLSARETVNVVSWPTRVSASPIQLGPEQAALLPVFRLGMAGLTEAQAIDLALSNPRILGVDATDASRLRQTAAKVYQDISADPLWKNCPSLLSYCFAERQPAEGKALVVVPDGGLTSGTPVVVFLHGDGGLFIWYAYRLHQIFPEALLVFPAYGLKPALAPSAYLDEALRAAWTDVAGPPPAPHLVGLSAGGFAVQRIWVRRPSDYAGLLVLGAFAPSEVSEAAPYGYKIAPTYIIGADEPFIRDASAMRDMALLRRRIPKTIVRQIPGADHFFMLTHGDDTAVHMRAWLVSGRATRAP